MRCALLGLMFVTTASRAAEVPLEKHVLVLIRVLAYDENLSARAGATLTLAVLKKDGHPTSEKCGERMYAGFQALRSVKVQGMALNAALLSAQSAAKLKAAVEDKSIDVFFLCPGLEADLAAICEVSRSKRVLTVTSQPEYAEQGASLSVSDSDGRMTILLNLAASKEEGASFGSALLKLAKVIK